MKIILWVLVVLLTSPLAIRAASPPQDASATGEQQQDDAVAAAARKARERRKNEPKSTKVWDNDNVPTSGMINVVGQAPEPAPDASAAVPAGKANVPAAPANSRFRQAADRARLSRTSFERPSRGGTGFGLSAAHKESYRRKTGRRGNRPGVHSPVPATCMLPYP